MHIVQPIISIVLSIGMQVIGDSGFMPAIRIGIITTSDDLLSMLHIEEATGEAITGETIT